MILGFPGSTERFMSSYGIDQTVNYEYPKRVDIRGKKLTIMKSYMDNDVDTRLAYSSKYAQVANYWKNFQGMTEQVKNNKVWGAVFFSFFGFILFFISISKILPNKVNKKK